MIEALADKLIADNSIGLAIAREAERIGREHGLNASQLSLAMLKAWLGIELVYRTDAVGFDEALAHFDQMLLQPVCSVLVAMERAINQQNPVGHA